MAFPQVTDINNSITSTNQTSHTVNLPANISIGNLLLILFGADNAPGISFPVGWNEIKEIISTPSGSSIAVAWKKADGSEGANITVTTGTAQQTSHFSYRITGAEDPERQPPEVSTGVGSNASVNPDPDSLTPTGGAKDYLWFAFEGNDAEFLVTVYPTNYGNGQTQKSNTAGGCSIGVARRELNVSSENPGAFTIAASQDWTACTIAIHPATLGKINIADAWKAAESMKINIGDSWKVINGMKINIGDSWKDIF